ncbi:transposase [Roseateles sp. BYS180W]|uniref:Transposase n=1 Tax=Roseateles rivi TaxID=3299028 RepID=A0ABW7FRE8_9BURK
MARLPRLAFAKHCHYLIHRGHNGAEIVRDEQDAQQLMAVLRDTAQLHAVTVHAYAVLPKQLHILATPDTAEGLSGWMQALGRRYVAYFNGKHGRRGTLWDGRFRAAPIDARHYALAVMRSIELCPVWEGLVAAPEHYGWSSCAHHLGRQRDPLVTDAAEFWALGNTPFERELAWQQWLQEGESSAQRQRHVEAALKGWALGTEPFLTQLALTGGRPLQPRPRGRPRKDESVPK